LWCLQKGRPRYYTKPNLLPERKSLNVKVLFIKSKSEKWKMFQYGISKTYKPIPQLSIFCLILVINNYPQINTYWSCIVRIGIFINLASNMLLLASKKCFLTSQGLVGTGMNCRALQYNSHCVTSSIPNILNIYLKSLVKPINNMINVIPTT
jgi:hypothetical protein